MMYYVCVDQERIQEHVAVSASDARAALNAFLRDNGLGHLTSVLLIEKGGPFEAVRSAVKKVQADLLVIGTS